MLSCSPAAQAEHHSQTCTVLLYEKRAQLAMIFQPGIPVLAKKKKPKILFKRPLMSLSPSMHLAAPNQNLPGHCNLDTIDQHCSDLNFKQPAILIPLSPSSESKHYGFYREEGPGHTLDLHNLRIREKAVNTNRINFN